MREFSKEMLLISPKLNKDLLNEILQRIFGIKNCIINNITFNNDCKKGDSYLSTVTRFTVKASGIDQSTDELRNYVLSAIAKSLPANIGRRKTFRSLDFFKNEVAFYNVMWKAMDEFQKSKTPKGVFNQIPLCISAFADGHNDYIILEDLSFKNYVSVTRGKGLDLIHTQLIMRLFAKFHALGLAFKNQRPKKFEDAVLQIEETYFAEKFRPWYHNFLTRRLYNIMRDAVSKQLPKVYLDKLNALFESDFYGTLIYNCNTTGPLSVITHGDAWLPNFLINYNESGNPDNAVIIDFQLARHASLANDITFFLYSCTDQLLRVQHWDSIIEDYHKTFVQTLNTLGSDPNLLTLDALKAEIKDKAVFGVGMSMEALTMSLIEDDEVADLDLIKDDQGVPLESVWVVHPFKMEEKRQQLANIIKHAVDNGFI